MPERARTVRREAQRSTGHRAVRISHVVLLHDQYRLFEGNVGELSLRVCRANAEFRMHTAYQLRDAHMIFGVLTGLSSFARLFGWLIGKDLSPLTVKVCYGPVLDEQLVAWLLPGRVEFEAEDNLLCFPAGYLALPLVRGAAELDELLATFPFDLAAGHSSVTPASAWVRRIFATELAHRRATPHPAQPARREGRRQLRFLPAADPHPPQGA